MYFKTDQLTVGYNEKPIIENIEIGIERGGILCLIGPNGCGKSTVLKTITNQLRKIKGSVILEDIDLSEIDVKEMAKKISVVLTERIEPEMMTCKEVVATGRYPYTNHFGKLSKEDECIIEEALELTETSIMKNQLFIHLSDGQKQRILLARALCQQPSVIVLDEPTSYLDIKHKIGILKILQNLSIKKDLTVVLSLHEIDLAAKFADKIVLIKDNKIVKIGSPEDILDNQTIRTLYQIEEGCYDRLLGSIELPIKKQQAKIFAVAGGGQGALVFRALQKKQIAFCVGILEQNDIDYYIAQYIASQVFYTPSFMPIDNKVIHTTQDRISQSELVIDCGFPIGSYNKENLQLLEYANKLGIPIWSIRQERRETIDDTKFEKINELVEAIMKKFF